MPVGVSRRRLSQLARRRFHIAAPQFGRGRCSFAGSAATRPKPSPFCQTEQRQPLGLCLLSVVKTWLWSPRLRLWHQLRLWSPALAPAPASALVWCGSGLRLWRQLQLQLGGGSGLGEALVSGSGSASGCLPLSWLWLWLRQRPLVSGLALYGVVEKFFDFASSLRVQKLLQPQLTPLPLPPF